MSFDMRRLSTSAELKAFAHPLRLAIMEQLGLHGPMTASELGDVLDETPANCSWHLRKLAEHNLVEETHDGQGRRRPWRATSIGHTWDETSADPVANRAGQALSDQIIEREVARFRANRTGGDDPAWEVGEIQSAAWMTADEAAQLHADLTELSMRYRERLHDPATRPEGARLVHSLFLTSVNPQ